MLMISGVLRLSTLGDTMWLSLLVSILKSDRNIQINNNTIQYISLHDKYQERIRIMDMWLCSRQAVELEAAGSR